MSSNTHEGQMFDGIMSTYVKTHLEAFPWVQFDFITQYRVRKVAILSGEEPLSNLDIRVGDSDLSSSVSGGNQWMSGNERCGKFFGPTLVPQQLVEVDCGFI